ncbi:MAG: hypothetical protein HZA91_01775 [Verrucomicrobia bacterium]|nr:hypothetical protein [Verrucomicrobiota bacterium]
MSKLLDWARKNIGLVIGGVISLGVIGWIGWRAWDAFSRQQTATEDLQQALSKLERLHKRKPYPHPANMVVLSNNFERLSGTGELRGTDDWLETLVARSPALADLMDKVQGSGFNTVLVQRKNTLLAKAKDNAVTLPENFGFGFGRYVTLGVAPTNNLDGIRLLLTQWSAVETISQVLFSNRVERIEAIRRATFDISRDPGAPPGSGQGSEESVIAPIRDVPGEVLRVLPFEMDFVCDNDSLRGVLGGLTAAAPFLVVRSIEVSNDQSARMLQGGRPEELGRVLSAAAAAAAAAAAPAPTPGSPGEMPAPEVARPLEPMLVFGLEKLNVKMRVDLVEFRKPAAPPAQ